MTKTEKQELWDFINVLYRLPLKEKKEIYYMLQGAKFINSKTGGKLYD